MSYHKKCGKGPRCQAIVTLSCGCAGQIGDKLCDSCAERNMRCQQCGEQLTFKEVKRDC